MIDPVTFAVTCLVFSIVIAGLAAFVAIYATKPNRAAESRSNDQWVKQETENNRLREMVVAMHVLLAGEKKKGGASTLPLEQMLNPGTQKLHRNGSGAAQRRPNPVIGIEENLEG